MSGKSYAKNVLSIDPGKFTSLILHSFHPLCFKMPEDSGQLMERIEKIGHLFNEGGTINARSKIAEEYALCLIEDKKPDFALEVFETIAGICKTPLLIDLSLVGNGKYFKPVAEKAGKLGYEGIFAYAKLLAKVDPHRSVKLLLEIANNVPIQKGMDISVNVLNMLLLMGVTQIRGRDIKLELEEARKHEY